MENYLETTEFTNALDFLDYLQLRNPRWLPPHANSTPWIFRGQYDADLGLIPKALRPDQIWFKDFKKRNLSKVSEFLLTRKIEYKVNEFQPQKERLANLILQIAAEWNAVDEFIELAELVGHQIPDDDDGIYFDKDSKLRWEMIAETFTRDLSDYRKYDQWDTQRIKYALAQHHGIPTRLLDWTYYPI